jgi:hypothetical protein
MPSKIVVPRAVGPAQFAKGRQRGSVQTTPSVVSRRNATSILRSRKRADKVVIFIALDTPVMFKETSLISLEVRKESTCMF